ncbi:MAG: SDR family NAD(P)-dependent oxidoreductase [Leptolyngbya sp. SIO1D8]|nr:SDR family NAD(P)-dependent oxidoreductase [Leptolyngbya sp. SIO1D8]
MEFGEGLQQGNALIVGASQGIGLGFVRHLLNDDRMTCIYATYRHPNTASELLALQEHPKLICWQMNATVEEEIAQRVQNIQANGNGLDLVINCIGVLHNSHLQPEKSLRQIDSANLLQYFQVNSLPTVLLAKHLQPLLKKPNTSVFTTISAKVGSIADNRLGGWYGYRASKAALNMFLKTIAIEYRRKNPHTIVVALHPGTTNTRLSKPFQRNVPPEKLFSVDRTVSQLLAVINQLTEEDNGMFFSWDGSLLPW